MHAARPFARPIPLETISLRLTPACCAVYSRVPQLYMADRGGFILAPSAAILCVCQGDCNSVAVPRGSRGCYKQRCCDHPAPRCAPPGYIDHDCSYPATELGEALSAQLRRGVKSHNEVVIDDLEIAKKLPDAIEGFFFMSQQSRAQAARLHGRFLQAFGLTSDACPLVRLELAGTGDPFHLEAV